MIGFLSGNVLSRGADSTLIDVGGVGYLVFPPGRTLLRLTTGEPATLYIHTHVREDALRLYGFDDGISLKLFERLLGVSGVGPRIALAALNQFEPNDLIRAIIDRDVRALSRISGVGKRTAERIGIDLAEPLAKAHADLHAHVGGPSADKKSIPHRTQVVEGLRYLGYKDKEIRAVLADLKILPKSPVEVTIRKAIALLQKG